MKSQLARALVALACATSACATGPIGFSGKAVESPIRPDQGVWSSDTALVVRFELVNLSRHRVTVSIWGDTALRIESIMRDGKTVPYEEYDPRWVADPRDFQQQNMRVLEADQSVTFDDHGVSDLRFANDTWDLHVWPLVRGHYRVVYSYQYDGPDYDKPNVFHGRVVARPIYFTVE